MYVKFLYFCLFFLFNFQVIFAQKSKTQFAEGEFLIQLETDYTSHVLSDLYAEDCGLKIIEQCSKILNIWRVAYNTNTCEHASMHDLLARTTGVTTVQNNHIIYKRQTLPNDYIPWPLNNPSTDADIDAPEVWDYDTGDTTALGDQIVIAIVDGGFDSTDPDGSYWTNTNEIPNNGIDDDNNGYIDDFKGWNVIGLNDSIETTSDYHGHNVSKRAARKGNNGQGSSTINWDVLTMPVLIFGGSESLESRAIAALDYIMNERMIYDATDGADGSFIVSTNHSYGSGGTESDAPLWCAAYAAAGALGILSCGATSNSFVNVDTNGDLPTTCSQDHLISVTQTNENDILDAGYGNLNIDLGSPSEGSTSMATPLVSGTVALLLSAACPSFVQAYKDNPDSISLLIKDYILNGADTKSSLIGTTLTGGRLNAFNSLALLLNEQCGVPFVPIADFVANQQEVCVGDSVQFTDMSQLLPTNWTWTFSGGSPSSSILQNPKTVYDTPGLYSVTLYATNGSGTTNLVIDDFIKVLDETGNLLPYAQDFETNNDWTIGNANDDATWTLFFNDVCNDTVLVMDNYGDNNTATYDYLNANFDLTHSTNTTLSFDVAYAQYNDDFYDQLSVIVESCGRPDSVVYLKNATDLATAPNNTTGFVPANCSEWRTETIDLSYWDGEVIYLQFENFSNWGNYLYLDNIAVTGDLSYVNASLSAKILLEGAYYTSGTMNSLLTIVLPNEQPYANSPYFYSGTETLPIGLANIVDWVLVELREGTANLGGNRGTITTQTQAGFVLTDGTIVSADGMAPMVFDNLIEGQPYYFCIRHRNHLDVLSNAIVAAPNMTYDFTTTVSAAFGNQQQKLSNDGFAMMFAGDYTQDGVVQSTDYNVWKTSSAVLNTYKTTDGNLDGTVQTTDYDIWFMNKAKVGTPEIDF